MRLTLHPYPEKSTLISKNFSNPFLLEGEQGPATPIHSARRDEIDHLQGVPLPDPVAPVLCLLVHPHTVRTVHEDQCRRRCEGDALSTCPDGRQEDPSPPRLEILYQIPSLGLWNGAGEADVGDPSCVQAALDEADHGGELREDDHRLVRAGEDVHESLELITWFYKFP